jgi:hypothetical protein
LASRTNTVQQFSADLEARRREVAANLTPGERRLLRAVAHASDPGADGISVEECAERAQRLDSLRWVTDRRPRDGMDVAAPRTRNAPGR